MAKNAPTPARWLTVVLASLALPALCQTLHPQESWYVTDGEVRAIVENAGSTFIGGAFNFVGPHTGGGVAFRPADGLLDPSWPKIDGQVEVVIGDGAGGWYIGGVIRQVAGLPRSNIAHILRNGQVGLFQPSTDGRVRAMVLAGNRLYVGGDFGIAEGQARNGLAMFAVNDSATPLELWDPGFGLAAGAQIHALLYDADAVSTRVYAGGLFDYPLSNRNYAVFDGASGANVTPMPPNPDGRVKALALDGSTMYVAGEFGVVGGFARVGIARFPAGGGGVETWDPGLDGAVRALIVLPTGLYIGGDFTKVGAPTRNRIAAIDKTTGAAVAGFNPDADNSVHSLLLTGGRLYLGGDFLRVFLQPRSRIAVVDPGTGSPVGLPDPCATGRVASLAVDNGSSRVFAGGAFTGFNCLAQDNLAKLKTSDGSLEPAFVARANGPVNALQLSGGWLYAGGEFTALGSNSLPRIGRLDPNTGASNAIWSPSMDFAVRALDIDPPTNRIFVGGDFTRVNTATAPATRYYAAAFSTLASGVDPSWDPDLDGPVRTLKFVGGANKVDLGGNFSTLNANPPGLPAFSRSVAAVDDVGGGLVANFDVDGPVYDLLPLLPSGDLYFGGSFTMVSGSFPRNSAAAVNAPAPAAPTGWNPIVQGQVFTLQPDGGDIYIGGSFNRVDNPAPTFRNNIALVSSGGGGLRPWDPNIDGTIRDIHSDPIRVYVGGLFNEEGPTLFRQNLAVYCKLGAPSPPTATPVGNNRIDLSWPASGATSYNVYRRHASFPWMRIATGIPSGPPTLIYVDTNVESSVNYEYRVSAFQGCESERSPTTVGTANGACNLPPQFDGAVAVEQEPGAKCGVRVFWRPAAQVCGGTYTYSVYRGAPPLTPDASNRLVLNAQCGADCSYLDSAALAAGTPYSYIVRATDIQISQEEDQNTFEQIITLADCTDTQPAPLRVFTTRSADGENRLEWVNPGGPYLNTEIRSTLAPLPYPSGPGDGNHVGTIWGVAGAKDSFVDAGLVNGQTYQYAAFVFAGGPAPYSNPLQSNGRPAAAPAEQRWGYKTAAVALSPTAVVPGRTYLPVSNDRMLHAVTAGDVPPGGAWPAAWQPFAMNQPAQSRPTVIEFNGTPPGTLPQRIALVSSQDGRVYCFNADTGLIAWTSPVLGATLTGSPSVMSLNFGGLVDRVFVGTRDSVGDNVFYGLDLASGTPAGSWTFNNGGGPTGIGIISFQPVVDYQANRVYFTSRSKGSGSPNTVWALNITAGGFTPAWARACGDMDAAASRPQGSSLLIVGNNAGQVRALNTADGSDYWMSPGYFPAGGGIKGFVFPQANSSRLFFSAGGTIYAINNNGAGTVPTLQWFLSGASPSTPLVTMVGGQYQVFWGADNGCLYRRISDGSSAAVGVPLGSPGPPPRLGQPTLDFTNSRLLLGSDEGRIYVVDLNFPGSTCP